ncbi:MAG: LamG domain-containing protein, partial [Nanoarchaeota archaeon]
MEDSLSDGISDDFSGFNNNGGCSTSSQFCPSVAQGKFGSSYQFDGINDEIKINSNYNLQLQKFTVSAWVYLDSYPTQWTRIIGKSNFNFASNNGWEIIVINENNVPKLNARLGGSDYIQIVYPKLPIKEWHLITLTYDGSTAKLYIDDGIEIKRTFDCTGCNGKYTFKNLYGKYIPQNTLPLGIGKDYTNNRVLQGKIDDVRIYNRALSNDEVKKLYQGVLTTAPSVKGLLYEVDDNFN